MSSLLKAPADVRLMAKVNKTATCWLWIGYLDPEGYGSFSVKGRNVRVHRFSYEMHHGPIPEGLTVDHLCRVRNCVNPAHLRVLTVSENSQDNGNLSKSHCPKGHPYDEANTYLIKNKRNPVNGRDWRDCRACRSEASRRRSVRGRKR